jgi:hypothetical protein
LLLGQELADLAAVVTLGSASARPDTGILAALLIASPWFVATDGDSAGDRAADGWPARARRVRPPAKDWTDAYMAGVDLRRWWHERITLETFLARLQARGIRVDGRIVRPRITIGTVTGRVTYTDPALQTLPERDRLARLTPVAEGCVFVRADYGQVEPRILHSVLHRGGLITWPPGDDLYATLAPEGDRNTSKTAVNAIINGGKPNPGAAGRLADFIRAVQTYRDKLAADARSRGRILTLAGRPIPLAAEEADHVGKAVNRLVQGTAADLLNLAAVNLDRALGALGHVVYLLHDELWVECAPGDIPAVAGMVRAEMMTAGLALGIIIPVRIDPDPEGPSRFTWDHLCRWRWGSAVRDHTLGTVIGVE